MYTVHCGVVFIAFWMLHLDCSTVDVHVFLQLKHRVLMIHIALTLHPPLHLYRCGCILDDNFAVEKYTVEDHDLVSEPPT